MRFETSGFFFLRFYLFIFREGGKEGEREGEKYRCVAASHIPHAPYWRPGPQPRHVPWPGIKLATCWFTGLHSIHWATQPGPSGFLENLAQIVIHITQRVRLCLFPILVKLQAHGGTILSTIGTSLSTCKGDGVGGHHFWIRALWNSNQILQTLK